jgi:Predicted permeases
MPTWQILLIVCPLIFMAGFIDSIAGGGGLISLPAFLLTGLPVHQCYGTNKVASALGTTMAAVQFYKNKAVDIKPALFSSVFSLLSALVGTQIALRIPGDLLKKIFLLILPVIAVFVLFFSGKGKQKEIKLEGKKLYITCAIIGVVLGLYDGMIGPGTGTMLIFMYTTFVGYDYIMASGNAKIVNLASNIAAAASYLIAGHVLFVIMVPAAVCNIAGNYVGSNLAMKKGDKFIKGLLVVMLISIFAKLFYDTFLVG